MNKEKRGRENGEIFFKAFWTDAGCPFSGDIFCLSSSGSDSGDPVYAILGNKIRPEQYERVYKELGLDKPFLVRYGEWLSGLVQGDFGRSIYYKVPVVELLAKRLPITFL
ncbi:hypothetical protein LC724_27780 [Blautia sp. RD014234]|nr:hypothetical protein [Blautia parvula]